MKIQDQCFGKPRKPRIWWKSGDRLSIRYWARFRLRCTASRWCPTLSRMRTPFEALEGVCCSINLLLKRFLLFIQNIVLQTSSREYYSGYRVYAVKALKHIPFYLNTSNFYFWYRNNNPITCFGIPNCRIPPYQHIMGMKFALWMGSGTLSQKYLPNQVNNVKPLTI